MIPKKVKKYVDENFTEVLQTTLNPEGLGVCRIHLIPPKYDDDFLESVAIINGRDIIPVNYSWTVLLSEFIREVNKYEGREVHENDIDAIIKNVTKNVRKVFPFISKRDVRRDVYNITKAFQDVACNREPETEIPYMSIGDYAKYMKAPHRMDIMVSAMTKDNAWHCNQKCVHCYAAGQVHAEEKELSTDEWILILDKLRTVGVPQVTFTGGEPTLREDLFKLIKHARWFISRLNTNGLKLTEEYCQGLKEAELDNLQITFYSSDKDIHNALVGVDGYDRTVEGIKNALKVGLSLSINTPLCTLNKDYVGTLKFLHELGVSYVTCSGIITTGNALKDDSSSLQLSNAEIEEILDEACKYAEEAGMEISFTSPGWLKEDFFKSHKLITPNCGACLSNMAITPSGNVVPCQSWLNEEHLGNFLNDDWDKIWNSDECKKHRKFSSSMLGKCPLRRM